MYIRDLDLRDLFVFSALLSRRSVTKAAVALKLPQPTVSRSLAKLREQFGDPLFVRTKSGMEPTPVATTAADAIAEIVRVYEERLFNPGSFDPARSRREFFIAASDVGHLLVLPRLYLHAAKIAPSVRFTAVPLSTRPLIEELASGEVDIAVGGFPNLFAGVMEQTLYREEYVCLVRQDHPIRGKRFSLADFTAADHVVVSTKSLGHIHQQVEKRLLELCAPARVRMITSSFIVSALVVETTDLVLTVPGAVGKLLAKRSTLRRLAPPIELPGFEVKQYWHERFHRDPANQWLRQCITSFLRA
jgi:DNA-binding transcriptional LysR family regulator